jgi:hypothetical protein
LVLIILNLKSSYNKLTIKTSAGNIRVFRLSFKLENKKPPTKPPRKKNEMIEIRSLIVALILSLFGWVFGKNNCDSSIPKSVNNPVKCVVLTTALDIVVTNEF